jgi:hypothetical protein
MRKQYRKLTQEQKARGVIFSSQLLPNGVLHEVMQDDKDIDEHIKRLKDDKFFNGSPYSVNEIRE